MKGRRRWGGRDNLSIRTVMSFRNQRSRWQRQVLRSALNMECWRCCQDPRAAHSKVVRRADSPHWSLGKLNLSPSVPTEGRTPLGWCVRMWLLSAQRQGRKPVNRLLWLWRTGLMHGPLVRIPHSDSGMRTPQKWEAPWTEQEPRGCKTKFPRKEGGNVCVVLRMRSADLLCYLGGYRVVNWLWVSSPRKCRRAECWEAWILSQLDRALLMHGNNDSLNTNKDEIPRLPPSPRIPIYGSFFLSS